MAEDFAKLQRQRAQAEAAKDAKAVAYFDAKISALGQAATGNVASVPPPPTMGDAMQRGRQAELHGLRTGAEGAVGTAGDAPGIIGGTTSWLANKIPGVSDEQAAQAGQVIEEPVRVATKAVTGGYAADVVMKALQMAGIISPETAQSIQTSPPTTEQVHGMTSTVLPESVNRATEMPQDPSEVEKGISFGTSMLPNLVGGPEGGIKQALTRVGTRVVAPTLAESAVGPITDKLVASGRISPEDAMAIKTVMQLILGGGGAGIEKGLSQRAAASTVTRNPEALRAVREGLIADGMNPAQADARIAELGGSRAAGGEAMIVDLGEHGNVEQLGAKAGVAPGTGGAELKQKLEQRSKFAGERIRAGQEAAIGPPVNRDVELERFQKRSQKVGSQYDLAKQNQVRPSATQSIADQLDSELAVARGGLRGPLEEIRKSLDLPGAPGNLDPSAEGMHQMRMAIDQQMSGVTPGTPLFNRLDHYRKLVDAELKDIAPRMKQLDKRYSGIKGEQEAYLTGEQGPRKPVEGSGSVVSSDAEFKTTWDNMPPREQDAMRRGTSRWIDQQTGMTDRERVKLKSALAGDWNEAKLRTQFGDQKIDSLKAMLEREDIFQERRNLIVHGSKTGLVTDKGMPTGALGSGATTLMATGSPTAAAKATAITGVKNWIGKRLDRTAADQQLKSDIGHLLASDKPEDVFRAMEKLRSADKSALLPHAMMTALQARMEETGHR